MEEQTHQLDSARARNAYLRDLESRATANMDAEEYKALRRGWCLGSAEFKAQLQEELEPHLNKLSRDSITGEARRMHDEREAERLRNGKRKCTYVSDTFFHLFLTPFFKFTEPWKAQKLSAWTS